MMTPYELWQAEQEEKQAFDFGAIMPAIQHGQDFLASGMGHAALNMAGSHVLLNAGIKLKDKLAPQVGRWGNKQGVIHGLTGRKMRPGLHENMGLLVGKDTMALDYDAGRALTQKVMEHPEINHDPRKALSWLQNASSHPIVQQLADSNQTIKNVQQAVQGVKPQDLAKGPRFGGLFSTSTRGKNYEAPIFKGKGIRWGKDAEGNAKYLNPTKEQAIRGVSGAATNLAATAAGVMTGNHAFFEIPSLSVVNAIRGKLGNSKAGMMWTGKQMASGAAGKKRGMVAELATSLGLSPSAAEVHHIGAALGQTARNVGADAQQVAKGFQEGHVGDSLANFMTNTLGFNQQTAKNVGNITQGVIGDKGRSSVSLMENLAALGRKTEPERRLPSIADRKITTGMAAAAGAAGVAGVAAPAMFQATNHAVQQAPYEEEQKAASFPMEHAVRAHYRYLESSIGGCEADGLMERALERAKSRGRNKIIMNDVRTVHHENRSEKSAAEDKKTIFLGGKVSGKDGEWREEIKSDLREAGCRVIDPKTDPKKWDPAIHIYKEIKQILAADKVYFYKGGYFTQKEKEVCDVAGKDYEVVKDPQEIVTKEAFNTTVPVDMVGVGTRTPSAFPEDSRGHVLTTLHAAQMGDMMGFSLARYLRTQSLTKANPYELGVLMSMARVR